VKTESVIIAGVALIVLVLGVFAIYQTMTLTQQLDTANSKIDSLNSNLASAINNITALQASYNSLQNNYTILNTQLSSITDFLVTLGYGGQHTNTSNQQGAMAIETGGVNSNTQITVYVRNTGIQSEILGAAYVNNTLISGPTGGVTFGGAPAPYTLVPGAVVTVVITGIGTTWADGNSRLVKIVATDGTPAAYSVHS